MKKNLDIYFAAALFIIAFWLWTLPLQSNPLPFGEGDAVWQFTAGDSMYLRDRADFTIPKYLGYWYYGYNKILGPHHHEYPPPYHVNTALAQVFGGDRFVSAFIMIAILAMAACLSTFLLIRQLYGFVPGLMAGFGMIFSIRDIMAYLWGQRGSVIAFTFIPIILYSYYMYLTSKEGDRKKRIYLFAAILLLSSQYLFHIQATIVSAGTIVLFTILMWISEKRFPIDIKSIFQHDLKTYAAATAVLLLFVAPFLVIYLGPDETHELGIQNAYRLLSWFKVNDQPGYPVNIHGYPMIHFAFSNLYNNYLVPFIFVGIAILIYRREPKDLLLLSWLIALYLAIHLDVTGYFNVQRAARMLTAETSLFYSLIAIGLIGPVSFIKFDKRISTYVKYAIAIVFIAIIFQSNAKASHEILKNAYGPVLRLNPYQMEAAEWIRNNLPQDAIVIDKGTITYPKLRWMIPYSQRHITNHAFNWSERRNIPLDMFYYMVDYSDLALTRQQAQANQLYDWEQKTFANKSNLVYSRNFINIWHGNLQVFTNE